MIAMTIAEIAEVVSGEVVGPRGTVVTGPAFVDSRQPEPGGLFVAIPGERVDGNEYGVAAVASGAAAVISQRSLAAPGVVVRDPVQAIGVLAAHVLARLGRDGHDGVRGLRTIGITGSQGKTSCKDVLGQLLGGRGETVSTVGSLNNEIGVPLTALRATADTRFLVSEMGARGVGHIRYLTSMVRPVVGVVLNVGVAHVGEFGSQAQIAVAKGELVEALSADGVAVLNADDPLVAAMRDRTAARVLTFGTASRADVRYSDVHLDEAGHVCFALAYEGSRQAVTVALVGEHHAGNAAAAAAAALGCGLTFDEVCEGLGAVSARSHWRMEVATTAAGVTVINDAYNANPDSMRAAVSTLAALARRAGTGRTFAVLGEMRELGASADDEHAALGRQVAALDVSRLVVVGEPARAILHGALEHPTWAGQAVLVADQAAATAYLRAEVRSGDLVLVKASRLAGLETVAAALFDDRAEAGVPETVVPR